MQNGITYHQLDLATRIVLHLNYRDIFNAPVKKGDLLQWLGLRKNDSNFESTIHYLKTDGNIEEKNGYLCVAGRSNLITEQVQKTKLTQKIIQKRQGAIRFWSKLPFIRFVGLSGSLAAENPTIQRTGILKDSIDIDLFMITAPNTLWLIFFFQRVVHWGLLALGLVPKHFLCINYVMEVPELEIYNKNFYTATELINLKKISGESTYHSLLAENSWFQNYYAVDKFSTDSPFRERRKNRLLAPINYLFFILLKGVIAIKDRKVTKWSDFHRQFNYEKSYNYRRIAGRNGGFQEQIISKFEQALQKNFPKYYKEELIKVLFPTEFSPTAQDVVSERDAKKMTTIFSKYKDDFTIHKQAKV